METQNTISAPVINKFDSLPASFKSQSVCLNLSRRKCTCETDNHVIVTK